MNVLMSVTLYWVSSYGSGLCHYYVLVYLMGGLIKPMGGVIKPTTLYSIPATDLIIYLKISSIRSFESFETL